MKKAGKLFLVISIFLATVCFVAILHAEAWARGHFYVIGTGPAGPELATLQALETIKRMDVIVAPRDHLKLFSEYTRDKPILFDPWTGIWDYKGKPQWKLENEEVAKFRVERFRIRDERIQKFNELLSDGKDIGLLDSGNPCLFGPSHWYVEALDPEDVVIIPGMGSDAAAMAALKRSTIPSHGTRFVLQSSPFLLAGWNMKDRQLLEELSKYETTMILYMALWQSEKLFEILKKTLPSDMPCAAVYWAGYPDRERVQRGTIGDMAEKLAGEKEKYMGLLLIGRYLNGQPYESAMIKAQEELKK